MSKLQTLVSCYLVVLAALVARSVYYPAAAVRDPEPTCKRGGFLNLGCSKGCVKAKGQCVWLAPPSVAAPSPPAAAGPSGHSLMKRRTVQNCLAAADAFEAEAEATTAGKAAAQLQMLAADAINCAMRTRGNGNILLVEGTSDTPENKKFWATHGPRALALVRAAISSDPSLAADARARVIELDAFMYNSASKGILRQAVTGAGVEFKRLADEFTATHTAYDGGVGHTYLAGFYHVAPWPLGDKKRAIAEAEASVALSTRSRRNGYYVCLFKYLAADAPGAKAACAAATAARCDGDTEPDYCPALTREVARVSALVKAMA